MNQKLKKFGTFILLIITLLVLPFSNRTCTTLGEVVYTSVIYYSIVLVVLFLGFQYIYEICGGKRSCVVCNTFFRWFLILLVYLIVLFPLYGLFTTTDPNEMIECTGLLCTPLC